MSLNISNLLDSCMGVPYYHVLPAGPHKTQVGTFFNPLSPIPMADQNTDVMDDVDVEPTIEHGADDNIVIATKVVNNEKRSASTEFDPGSTLDEAVALYGDKVVFDLYKRAAVVKLQAQLRGRLEQGFTTDQIAEEFSGWRPDQDRTPSRDPRSAILSGFNKLSDDDREALIAQLRAQMGTEEAADA